MELFNSQYQELYHHGITGQKWGAKNGPPYPLSGSQMTPIQRAKNSVSKFAQDRAKAKIAKETEKRKKIQRKISVEKAKDKTKAKKEELKNLKEQNKIAAKSNNQKIKETVKENQKENSENTRKKMDLSSMSNQEIQALATRLNQEDQIQRLTGTGKYAPKSFSQQFMDKAIKDVLVPAATEQAKQFVNNQIKNILNEKVGGSDTTNIKKTADNIKNTANKVKEVSNQTKEAASQAKSQSSNQKEKKKG